MFICPNLISKLWLVEHQIRVTEKSNNNTNSDFDGSFMLNYIYSSNNDIHVLQKT